MDNFSEQLVRRQETNADKTKRLMILFGGIFVTLLLAVLAFLMLGQGIMSFVMLLLAAGAGYGAFFMYRNTLVEYEYAFTNGELDVDKIIAQSKRVGLLSVQVSKFTAFGKYDESMEESEDMTVIIVSDNIASHEYFADFPHDEYGSSRLIFSPDEKMLENIKKSLPRSLKMHNA